MSALDPARYEIVPIGILKSGKWLSGPGTMAQLEKAADPLLLRRDSSGQAVQASDSGNLPAPTSMPEESLLDQLDVIFPVLHGPYGEDGTVQGLLDLLRIPYVGCGVLASSVGMDKIIFKQIMIANRIPVVPYEMILRKEVDENMKRVLDRLESRFSFPVFCKPANMGSSVGITKCNDTEELKEGLMEAAKYDCRILVESGVKNAREVEVSVLGNEDPEASVPGEVIPSRDFYDYASKYMDAGQDASELIIPAKLPAETTTICRNLAIRSFQAIDGAGMARVDFLLDESGQELFVNEINTIPGFTSISMYSKLWAASGLTYPELIDRLIELAFKRFKDRNRNQIGHTP